MDATDSASSRGEDELQRVAVKMNFKRQLGRRDRRKQPHLLESWHGTSGSCGEDEHRATAGPQASATDATDGSCLRTRIELLGIAMKTNIGQRVCREDVGC